jgi:transcription elongation factor GreB
VSRAFVKEGDGEDVAQDLPERVVSAHRNLVTVAGLAAIEQALQGGAAGDVLRFGDDELEILAIDAG